MFTPLPPAATGTADYAAALIPGLGKLVDLQVFEKTPRAFDPRAFDAVFYQLGNNPFHAGIYETALRHPGIAVLHEPNLHDLIRGMNAGSAKAYLREVAYEVFGQEWDTVKNAGYAPAGQQPRHFSMLRRLLDRSRACVVHSLYAAGMVRMKGFRGRIERIPHGIHARPADGTEWRARLGLSQGQPLIGLFGYLRPDKRAAECLRAFRMLIGRMPDARMLIAGEPHPEVPVDRMVDQLGVRDHVFLQGHLPGEDLDRCIAGCDVVLNLRWPSFGETSGIAARAFGLGKAVVMSDTGAAREYPDDICVRIPSDQHLETVLCETLAWLLSAPDTVGAIGSAAAKWASENCGWPAVAQRYAEFAGVYAEPVAAPASLADMPAPRIREYLRRWAEPGTDRIRYLRHHEVRLSRTLQLIPPGSADDRILEMGCYMQITPALRNLLGYGEVRGSYLGSGGSDLKMATARDGETMVCAIDLFDCERDTFPYANGFFATVLCCELLEHLRRDPMRMMSEIYRILRDGGVLVLTTPNIVSLRALNAVIQGNHPGFYNRYPDPYGQFADDSKHEREYTPVEISKLLEAAGFIVEHIETEPYSSESPVGAELAERVLSSLGLPADLRGDCILAVARKAALPRDPRPSWLYDAPGSFEEAAQE
jgi:glycosyltransferase involved in cell wall biosynthesis/SAM-dependent methyltransferase